MKKKNKNDFVAFSRLLFTYKCILYLEDSRIILNSLGEYLLSPRRAEEHNRMTNGVTAGASSLRKPLARFIMPLRIRYSSTSTCSRRWGRYTDSGNAILSPHAHRPMKIILAETAMSTTPRLPRAYVADEL